MNEDLALIARALVAAALSFLLVWERLPVAKYIGASKGQRESILPGEARERDSG